MIRLTMLIAIGGVLMLLGGCYRHDRIGHGSQVYRPSRAIVVQQPVVVATRPVVQQHVVVRPAPAVHYPVQVHREPVTHFRGDGRDGGGHGGRRH